MGVAKERERPSGIPAVELALRHQRPDEQELPPLELRKRERPVLALYVEKRPVFFEATARAQPRCWPKNFNTRAQASAAAAAL